MFTSSVNLPRQLIAFPFPVAVIVRELRNYIPFWNVSLQDMAMVGRNLNTSDAWVKGFTAITLPTLLLKMTNEGNPKYEALTPVDKAAFWHLYFGDKHLTHPDSLVASYSV